MSERKAAAEIHEMMLKTDCEVLNSIEAICFAFEQLQTITGVEHQVYNL